MLVTRLDVLQPRSWQDVVKGNNSIEVLEEIKAQLIKIGVSNKSASSLTESFLDVNEVKLPYCTASYASNNLKILLLLTACRLELQDTKRISARQSKLHEVVQALD